METPFNMHSTLFTAVGHMLGTGTCSGNLQWARQIQSFPCDFMESGGSQEQVDSCFSHYLPVILGGKDTYRFLGLFSLLWFQLARSVFLMLSKGDCGKQAGLGTADLVYSTTGLLQLRKWDPEIFTSPTITLKSIQCSNPRAKHLFIH